MNYSRYLNKRVIILNEPIDNENASIIVNQLISLHDKANTKDIYILIDSPGGLITSGYAIFDTIRWCECDINTFCLSFSAGLSTLLLSAGTKGKRYAFSKALITPTLFTSANNESIYSSNAEVGNKATEKTIELFANLTENDYPTMKSACLTKHFLTSDQAQSKGFIDNVILDKTFSIRMIQASRHYKFLKNLEGIWYNNIIESLESMNIINS